MKEVAAIAAFVAGVSGILGNTTVAGLGLALFGIFGLAEVLKKK